MSESTCFSAVILLLIILVVMAVLCGCAPHYNKIPTENIVMFNENGRLVDPTGTIDCVKIDPPDPSRLCEGKHLTVLPYPELTEAQKVPYLNGLLDGLSRWKSPDEKNGKRRLLIFVHGGLNTQKKSVERAIELAPQIKAAGYYPLFINWRSSWSYNYFHHAVFVRQGEEWMFWGPVTSPFVVLYDLGRGLLRAPLTWSYQIEDGIQTWSDKHLPYSLDKRQSDLKEQYEKAAQGNDPEAIGIINGQNDLSGADKTLSGISWLVLLPFRVLSIPLIDGFGTGAWDNMVRQTRLLMHTPEEYKGGNPPEEATGDLADVMRKVKSELEKDPNAWEVVLVGHSMGTIVLNEMLRESPCFPVDTIVYMAAACSVRDFQQSVVPYLLRHKETEFYNLSLHNVAEKRERVDLGIPYFDPLMRGSLLVWIDDLYTNPSTPMDKTLGQYVNFLRTEQIYSGDLRGRIHQKEFSVGGKFTETEPQKHGDFDNFRFWEKGFYWK